MGEAFGKFVKELREAKGLSLQEAADSLKVSASFLNQVERGGKHAPRRVVIGLAALLEIDTDELLACNEMVADDVLASLQRNPRVRAALIRALDGGAAELHALVMADASGAAPERIRRAVHDLRALNPPVQEFSS
jgi:transcriptional regulator with XRE-family HTH domain